MKLLINTLMVLSFSSLGMPNAFAANDCETQLNCVIKDGDTTTKVVTKQSEGTVSQVRSSGGTTTETTTNYSSLTPGTGAYDQAQQAQNQSMATSLMGAATAASQLPQCGPHNKMACVLGAAGLAVAALGAAAANNAQAAKDELGGEPTIDSTTDVGATEDSAGVSTSSLDNLKKAYAKKGYGINDDGSLSLPGGQKISSLDSASLRKAGFSGSDAFRIREGMDNMKRSIADKTNELNAASASSSGGGGGRIPGSVGAGGPAEKKEDKPIVPRAPASWAGFSKQYGDSNIGVSQADIFVLIEQRVEQERKAMGQ